MTIPPGTMKRLAFAKYLFSVGIEQSKSSNIQAAAAILSFHDSIEFFLQIASEHLNAGGGKREPVFLEYWQILESKLNGSKIPQEVSMRRLHRSRNGLKHGGTIPSKLDIDEFRVLVKAFLEEACQTIFNLRFGDISLVSYVRSEAVRLDLRRAEDFANGNDYDRASEALAISFQRLMDESLEQVGNPFFLNPLLLKVRPARLPQRSYPQSRDEVEIVDFAKGMEAAIYEIRNEFRLLAAGVNYSKYARFRASTPRVVSKDGDDYITQLVKFSGYIEPCSDFINFGVQFVIDCSIRFGNHGDSRDKH